MLALVMMVAGVMPATASAQPLREPLPLRRELLQAGASQARASRNRVTRALLSGFVEPARAAAVSRDRTAAQPAGTSKRSALGWAIAAGIAGGIGVSAIAASKYGDNETGQFCTRCFMQWSAISIPVGAGIGAGVGYLIDRARR
jgi:hypothetical protein